MSVLSERLKQLRGDSSQTEMANPLGMKYQQWARYEKGEVVPSADIVANICRAHACSADWLLGLDDIQRSPPPKQDCSTDRVKDLKKAIITLLKDY